MKAMNFDEVYSGVSASDDLQQDTPRNKPIEVSVKVAGPKQVDTKTVQFVTSNEGLIGIKFKEGGQLPPEMAGKFTDINSALSAVANWVARKERDVKVDAEIKTDDSNSNTDAPPPSEEQAQPESFDSVQKDTGKQTLSLGTKKGKSK